VKNKGKILALDFGQKTVGLAVSDEDQTMVFGRGVMKDYRSLAALFEKIKDFCVREDVIEIVMGVPVGREGEDTPQSERIRGFGEKLQEYLGGDIPVEFEDESFTSFEADEFLDRILHIKGRDRKGAEDELAAVLILKRYLDLEAV
jgi:putative holliday junction resolvase